MPTTQQNSENFKRDEGEKLFAVLVGGVVKEEKTNFSKAGREKKGGHKSRLLKKLQGGTNLGGPCN